MLEAGSKLKVPPWVVSGIKLGSSSNWKAKNKVVNLVLDQYARNEKSTKNENDK